LYLFASVIIQQTDLFVKSFSTDVKNILCQRLIIFCSFYRLSTGSSCGNLAGAATSPNIIIYIENDGEIICPNPTASDIKAFNILRKLTNVGEGGVICQCDRVMSIIEGVRSIPFEFI
jgi:hypothetical protein